MLLLRASLGSLQSGGASKHGKRDQRIATKTAFLHEILQVPYGASLRQDSRGRVSHHVRSAHLLFKGKH